MRNTLQYKKKFDYYASYRKRYKISTCVIVVDEVIIYVTAIHLTGVFFMDQRFLQV